MRLRGRVTKPFSPSEPSSVVQISSFEMAPKDWIVQLRMLRNLFRPDARSLGVSLPVTEIEEEVALAAESRAMGIEEFWRTVKSVLRLKPLRPKDGRRNVVQVLSAEEARQWVLAVVFVCGMVEKQFPQFHPQDPFFPDAARCRLNAAGIRVRTAAEFEREERRLFESATSRATMLTTLSYPEFDARGERTLPSLNLEGLALAPE